MGSRFVWRALAALAGLAVGASAQEASDTSVSDDPLPAARVHRDVFRQETDWFEVNAAEPEVGSLLALRLREVELALRPLVDLPEGLPVRVIVRLTPALQPADGARVTVSPGGLVSVEVPERSGAELDATWAVRAALSRGGAVNPGTLQEPVVAPWVEQGLVESVKVRLRPGLAQMHARRLLTGEIPPLGELLQAGGKELDPALCWIAVRCISQLPEGRARLLAFAREAAAAGADQRMLFLNGFSNLPELTSGVQAWWMVQVAAQAREQAGPEFTRDWPGRVRRLMQVEVERGEELAHLGAEEIWKLRRRPWVRELTRLRMREARLMLTEAPAFWYNAVLSAGQAWEALSRGKKEAFLEAWQRVPEDAQTGAALEAEIGARLEAWERRIGDR